MPRSSELGTALRAALPGLSPTTSARAAVRAAAAHSQSVWPTRTSCHPISAARTSAGTTATASTEA